MCNINLKTLIMTVSISCTVILTQPLHAQNNISTEKSESSGKNIREFLTPNGSFDLKAARKAGFQGSMNADNFTPDIDPATGQPVFRPSPKISVETNPDDVYWDNSMSNSIPGVNGPVYAMTVFEGKLIVGGYFSNAGGVVVNNIAAWNGTSWQPLESGMAGYDFSNVQSLTLYDGKLIAGGKFSTAGGKIAYNIASWDGKLWNPIGIGTSGSVSALTVYDGKLVAGGNFLGIGELYTNRIAMWDGSSWSKLGQGMAHEYYSVVYALTVYDGKLIAGGQFATAGGIIVNDVAAWNGSSWSPLGSGIGGEHNVSSVSVYGEKLIVGGGFTTAGGKMADNIAEWDGKSWSSIGSVIGSGVFALAVFDGKLIAGGYFSEADGIAVNNIAAWDGSSWSKLGTGIGGKQPVVQALIVYNDKLIVGGSFTVAGNKVAPYIAAWTKKDSTDVLVQSELPSELKLSPNYPNPFNPSTTIDFTIPEKSHVVLKIFNMAGQEVAILKDDIMSAGKHSLVWNAEGLPSGIYFYSMKAGNFKKTRKMVLVR